MKHSRFYLGTGMVVQLIKYRTEQQVSNAVIPKQAIPIKQKDHSIISSKFLKIFAVIVIIKIIVFLMLM
jgi:hypothetical protein